MNYVLWTIVCIFFIENISFHLSGINTQGQTFLDFESNMFSLLWNYKAFCIVPSICESYKFTFIFTGVATCGFFSPLCQFSDT